LAARHSIHAARHNIAKIFAVKLLRILFNRYLLTLAGFLALIIYFDPADLISQRAKQKELQDTKDNIAYLKNEVDSMDNAYVQLRSNPRALEKYAREQYRMKRDTEDLYVVEPKQ
jgi:cell division protein FtsB